MQLNNVVEREKMYKYNNSNTVEPLSSSRDRFATKKHNRGITTHRFIKSQKVKERISPKHLGQGVRIA